MNNKTVIYARLSVEDQRKDVSLSIQNQIEICSSYATNNNLEINKIYIDDGCSGTNFDRPSFKEMLEDIKNNKVKIILTKDLSRLGRNFIQTSHYIEEVFKQYGVRYIAINDGYDSFNDDEDISFPIRNFINDMYAKESGRKVQQFYDRNVKNISFINDCVYGYIKNKKDLIIDESVKKIIITIFDMYLKGYGTQKIATFLLSNKISKPYFHNEYEIKKKNVPENQLNKQYKWHKNVVLSILKNKVYIGTAVNKKYLRNKASKKVTLNPKPIEIENNHPPIIDKKTFYMVQEQIEKRKSKVVHVDDTIRLKKLLFNENDKGLIYRQVIINNKPVGRHYETIDKSLIIKADLVHDVLYKDAANVYLKLKDNYKDFFEVYKKRYNIQENKELYKNLSKQKELIDVNIQVVFERYFNEEINHTKYIQELERLNIKKLEIEEKLSNYENDNSINEYKLKRLKEFMKELPNETLLSNKLDFIRAMISKVIISINKNQYKFHIIYNFEK